MTDDDKPKTMPDYPTRVNDVLTRLMDYLLESNDNPRSALLEVVESNLESCLRGEGVINREVPRRVPAVREKAPVYGPAKAPVQISMPDEVIGARSTPVAAPRQKVVSGQTGADDKGYVKPEQADIDYDKGHEGLAAVVDAEKGDEPVEAKPVNQFYLGRMHGLKSSISYTDYKIHTNGDSLVITFSKPAERRDADSFRKYMQTGMRLVNERQMEQLILVEERNGEIHMEPRKDYKAAEKAVEFLRAFAEAIR